MALFGAITDALFRPSSRAIDVIIPDVVFEESHRDELIITQHPVEKGAAITDHAFSRPAEVEMRCGWSDSTAGFAGYSRQVYDRLRALQAERRPFTVYTGKRRYQNMLIRGLALTTDAKSEFAALIVVALQEVILTSTQTTGGQQSATTAMPGENSSQADPASTGSVNNQGQVAGIGQGAQSFAGAFSPGNASSAGGLGLGGEVGTALDGLSPPTATAEVGELTATDADGNPIPEATVPASPGYNPFATGAFGGT